MDFIFFVTSILLGIGLAMDAFSVSLANGLNEQSMSRRKMFGMAGIFAFFQGLMPLIGWICVHTILQYFDSFENFIPWIALILLAYIGIRMVIEGIKSKEGAEKSKVGFWGIVLQSVATSIDALSVGFTIAEHNLLMASISVLIIGVITFGLCLLGIMLGKKFGTKFSGKATIFGGVILILIGLEIFISSFF